jgi:hypothetical protein
MSIYMKGIFRITHKRGMGRISMFVDVKRWDAGNCFHKWLREFENPGAKAPGSLALALAARLEAVPFPNHL